MAKSPTPIEKSDSHEHALKLTMGQDAPKKETTDAEATDAPAGALEEPGDPAADSAGDGSDA